MHHLKTAHVSRPPRSAATLSFKARAIAALARRDYSRKELHQKLAGFADSDEDLQALLDLLESKKLLSNARFADAFINQRQAKFGASRLVYELEQHGLDPELIRMQKQQLVQTENQRAFVVWAKRFGSPPSSALEKSKQIRFLASRGFSPEVYRWLEARDFAPIDEVELDRGMV
jgi:regulatory protein